MLLIFAEGRFLDAVAWSRVGEPDCPDDAMFLAFSISHAVVLARVANEETKLVFVLFILVFLLPLGVRGVVAGLRPGECQVWADVLPEC